MKRIFALLLALLMLCTMVACSGKDDDKDDDTDLTVVTEHQSITVGTYKDCFEYDIINGDEVAIVGFSSKYDKHAVEIPDTIDDCPVVMIADGAFYQCSQLTGIKIPATVTEIGDMAFAGCVQLETVTFGDSATVKLASIGDYAFAKCAALKAIALPQTLTSLGEAAFYQCSALKSVLLPQGITEIKDMTFMSCTALFEVTSVSAVTKIGDYAFCGATELAKVHPITSLQVIGKYAFSGCKKLTPLTEADIPGLVIGENAFS